MPTDCFVLRTPTILPAIRISRDYHPAFKLMSDGQVPRSVSTYKPAYVDTDLSPLISLSLHLWHEHNLQCSVLACLRDVESFFPFLQWEFVCYDAVCRQFAVADPFNDCVIAERA